MNDETAQVWMKWIEETLEVLTHPGMSQIVGYSNHLELIKRLDSARRTRGAPIPRIPEPDEDEPG